MIRAFMYACLLGAVMVAPAAAGKPGMERIDINDVGLPDAFLTEACGTDVWVDGMGHITFRVFTDAEGNPIREVNNFAIRVRFYSDFGSLSVVDIGPDRVTYNSDGSIENFITGNVQSMQLPGEGRVYSDVGWVHIHVTFPEEGDPIAEFVKAAGQHWGDQLAVLCGALAPD